MKQSSGSWLASANVVGIDFPIENLPYGAFRRKGSQDAARIGVAIGDALIDCTLLHQAGLCGVEVESSIAMLAAGDMNGFMALGLGARVAMRQSLQKLFAKDYPQQSQLAKCLLLQSEVQMLLPCKIGDYTDFYTSIHHAMTVGKMFRPDNPLLPNYKWVPIGYHGRSSSIVVSGTDIVRPKGQTRLGEQAPVYTASQKLDVELELALWVGKGNALGECIDIAQAEEHMFGLSLLNDWSARDIQPWEYQPLGPFLSKNFATTVSPWLVTMEALQPFRSGWQRDAADPQPLAYIEQGAARGTAAIDVKLELYIETAAMRAQGLPAERLASSNYAYAYWTLAQILTHHSSNGCNLNAGDVLGTGTLSGPEPAQAGSLLELSQGGKAPIELPRGEARSYLQDGDRISLKAFCENADAVRIGFGECSGTVVAAR